MTRHGIPGESRAIPRSAAWDRCLLRAALIASAVVAVALVALGAPRTAAAQLSVTNPSPVTVIRGQSGSTTITASFPGLGGGNTSVSASVTGLPIGATFAGTTCVFPLNVNNPSCLLTLTIATTGTTPLGSFNIGVTVTPNSDISLPVTTTFTLTVNPPFDYSLANSGGVTVIAGGAPGATTITATLAAGVPQSQSVSFAVSGLPTGVTATPPPPSCTPTCQFTLNISAAAAAAPTVPVTSTITVTGSTLPNGAPVIRTTTFTLTVNPAFNYSLAANPNTVTVIAGGASGSTTIVATLAAGVTQSQSQTVSFSVTGLPTGVTATPPTPSCTPTCQFTLTITAAASTAPVTSTITVTGSTLPNGAPVIRTTTFTLTVNPQVFDYSLAANPNTVTVTAGGAAGSTTITAALVTGTTQAVSFTVSGLPTGVTATPPTPSCTPTCQFTLTITAATSTAPVTSTITVTGSILPNGAPVIRTTTFTLTVNALRTLAIVSGNNQTGVINAPLPNPLVVSVTPSTPVVNVTWEVTGGAIPSATSTPTINGLAQITLRSGPTPGPVTVRASVSSGGVVTTSAVTFVVNDATQAAVAGLKTFSVLGNLALTTATVQSTNIGLRLAALRGGGTGGVSVSGLSLNVAGQSVPLAAMTSSLASGPGGGASADPSKVFGGLGIFLNGQGSFGDQEGTAREPGFKFHTEGLTLGTDYRLTDNVVLGAAAGYLHTDSDLDEAGGRVKLNGYSLSAFGSYYVGDKFYLDAIATYGWNDFGTSRNVTFGNTSATAKADPDGNQFAVSVSGGYNFNVGPLTVGPTARVNYINVRIDSFQERGADIFNLRVNSQRIESLATDLGAQASYAISLPWGVLSPLVRAEWEHELKGGSRLISGSLAADPLRTQFSTPTNTPDRNYFNLAAGLSATLPRGASAFVHYETVLGRAHVTNHSFTAGVRFQFE